MTLAIWLHTQCTICYEQQQRQREWERRVKRVSCGRCGTVLCIKCQKLCGSAADLPGLCNGWARSVKPLLLSLIHVTQDNVHRSRGATVGDTEKEADPVGGWGGTEDGGMEGSGEWEIETRAWSDREMFRQSKSQTDTKTKFTELWQDSVIMKVIPLPFLN